MGLGQDGINDATGLAVFLMIMAIIILYISDEPHTSVPGIKEQMIVLCDMLHEAEPEVKIYASTWGYVPEWLGKLDVWGIGVQGQISEENL